MGIETYDIHKFPRVDDWLTDPRVLGVTINILFVITFHILNKFIKKGFFFSLFEFQEFPY